MERVSFTRSTLRASRAKLCVSRHVNGQQYPPRDSGVVAGVCGWLTALMWSGLVCPFRFVWELHRLKRVHLTTATDSSRRGDDGRLNALIQRTKSSEQMGLADDLRTSRDRRIGSGLSRWALALATRPGDVSLSIAVFAVGRREFGCRG